jgi:putative ABC transport system permease protein
MVIRAVYDGGRPDTDVTTLVFHIDYLDDTMKKTTPSRAGHGGFYMIGSDDPDRAGEISRAIDETFKNSQAETLTETEKAFQLGFVSMSEAILLAINLVSYVAPDHPGRGRQHLAMSVREPHRRIRRVQDPGFKGPTIAAMAVGES